MKTYPIEEKERVEKILTSEQICFVGFSDENGIPYVLPMNYGYENDTIYLHSAQDGKAIEILRQNPNVCITFCTQPKLVWQHPDVACSYRMQAESIICNGKVLFEENFEEKQRILSIIMRQYTDNDFKYSVPATNNVKVWKVPVDTISAKEFGILKPNAAFDRNKPTL